MIKSEDGIPLYTMVAEDDGRRDEEDDPGFGLDEDPFGNEILKYNLSL